MAAVECWWPVYSSDGNKSLILLTVHDIVPHIYS